ncbi:MAG TPA: MBL fold metallo-hydrolase [Chthoniobacteraceae bacterium]|nr:MBL fold metallo-hydrolase [Chthoniobacteraceae bacterium]
MNAPLFVPLALSLAWLSAPFTSCGEPALTRTRIAAAAESSVPNATAQGHSLAPQAVSAVDISPDGKTITVGTMAFSHEPNVWLLSPDGAVREKRNFAPWAPMQVSTAGGLTAVGMAMSRVTSPEPGVWSGPTEALFREPPKDELYQADARDSQLARWRSGSGDWRTGWFASAFGELYAHGPDWIFQPPNLFVKADGSRTRPSSEDGNQLPNHRAARMAVSADGRQVAFGWICLPVPVAGFPQEKNLLSVWDIRTNRGRWIAPATPSPGLPDLPNPAAEFPELLQAGFRLKADKIVRGTMASAVALSRDGSHVAAFKQDLWCWVRTEAAIGNWDPPIHVVPFVPKTLARLRVYRNDGWQLLSERMPEAGSFEIGFGDDPDELWCWPSSWLARGMAGQPWLPVNAELSTAYLIKVSTRMELGLKGRAVEFPDAIADVAVNPADGRALVSCWNGRVYLIAKDGTVAAQHTLGSPARLAWSADGSFAIAGTSDGTVQRLNQDGKPAWKIALPVAPAPVIDPPPAEVVPGIPVYQAGRIPKSEHAYVGDMWLLKLGREGVLVDAGGTSGFATSQARVKALDIDHVTHVLHTHSHGDHCGGAYLWRAAGAKIVAPKSAALALTWLMPMLTDYGIYPPRPVDLPLPLAQVGDETDFEIAGQKFHALFLPGHSFDLTVYTTTLAGKRIAFTGDLGFETNIDIVHRCWGDAEKARPIVKALREKLLPWQPDVVFTGHGVRKFGTPWLEDLIQRTETTLTAPK